MKIFRLPDRAHVVGDVDRPPRDGVISVNPSAGLATRGSGCTSLAVPGLLPAAREAEKGDLDVPLEPC